MKNTTWTFKKNGKAYSANGKNRFEAQDKLEMQFRIDLTGAAFKEIYKLRVIRTGIVK